MYDELQFQVCLCFNVGRSLLHFFQFNNGLYVYRWKDSTDLHTNMVGLLSF